LLIWLAYFLLPNDAGGLVHGLPCGPIETAAVLVVAWLWMVGRRPPGAAIVAALLAVTWTAATLIPGSGGFRARYFAGPEVAGAHERSTEFRSAPYTRIDRALDFNPDQREFPLPFFNDNTRFNFFRGHEPRRDRLAFAVRWSGVWWVEEQPRLYLDAPGSGARMFVDGVELMVLNPNDGSPIVHEPALTRGWHRLDIDFVSPYGGPRRFSAGLLDGATRQPFDRSMVVTQQIRDWQMQSSRLLQRFKFAADVAVLVCLLWVFITAVAGFVARARRRWSWPDARLAFAIAASGEAFVFAWPWYARNMVLAGGDDPMTYEGYARDILLNGILMNGGLPPGQGEPFYYQAFYPYFLAATHHIFGESMFGPMLIQRLLCALTVVVLVEMAILLAAERLWKAALPLATAFVAWKFWPIAAQPLNESLYVPLLVTSAWSLMRTCRSPRPGSALVTGVWAGLATITRSTALLAWAVAWPAAWLAMRPASRRTRVIAIIAASFLAIFSLVAARNWIVAGVFALTSTEFGITLLGGNEVPPGVTIDLAPRAEFYRRWRISEPTATVIEYAVSAPAVFAQNIGRKALFALGFYEPYAPGWGYSPVYILVWITAIAGLSLAVRRSSAPFSAAIPALIAVSQYAAVVIVYPKGERLILPIHVLLVPYASLVLGRLIDSMKRRLTPGSERDSASQHGVL
jgi:hypothetical protein